MQGTAAKVASIREINHLVCETINMKDVVYMVAAAWEDILSMTLTQSWYKLLRIDTNEQSPSTVEPAESDSANAEVMELAHQLDSNLEDGDVNGWLKGDSSD